jgi:hypothetical protein
VSSVLALLGLAVALPVRAEQATKGPPIEIRRADSPITIDADLSDPAWRTAVRVEEWFETNPGDNVPAKVKNVAYLAYDDKFLYAAFDFQDPDPGKIRAPYADRDNVPGGTDYGGIILDTRNDGKTGILFLANPRGIQYDAITSDASGNEDSSPDFFWDSTARITPTGWILEMRVPYSSLRYDEADLQTWGILLYRNYPRDFRYQMFSSKLPRGENCFICHESDLVGLSGLPPGGNWVVAPYVTANRESMPEGDLGSPLEDEDVEGTGGVDGKWTPNAGLALDVTVNPDFSQIEADAPQITANERFALFFPEKRPFFLEGVDLLSTPIQAVYTRTITAPSWGARATGKIGNTAYTVLATEDDGGGTVVLPRALFSDFAAQDFESRVGILRVRHDLGKSFVSFLATDREVDGGGYNRVFGPDFQWRPSANTTVTGQILWSLTETPNRPELAAEWDGRELEDHAGTIWASHSTRTWDVFGQYLDFGDDFRADVGFVPQVGVREGYFEGGYTFWPEGFVRRVRTFVAADYQEMTDGRLLSSFVSPGVGLDAKWNSFVRFELRSDRVRTEADDVFGRRRLLFIFQANPSMAVSQLSLDGNIGEQVDFANSREGHGGTVGLSGTVRPTSHLELVLSTDWSWVDVPPDGGGPEERLFTADVARVRATYTFTARSFLRLIGQYSRVERDPSLYLFPVAEKDGFFSGSALFSFKLNWQSVLFLGYGDERTLSPDDHLEKSGRSLFLKVSYAFQG